MDEVKYAALDAVVRMSIAETIMPNCTEYVAMLVATEKFLRDFPEPKVMRSEDYSGSGQVEINALTMGLVDPVVV